MLEILALIYLTKKNAATASEKGRSGVLFGFLTVALWLFCEFTVSVSAYIFLDVDFYVAAFLGLLGGATGGGISYLITKSMSTSLNTNRAPTFTPTSSHPQRVSQEPEIDYCRACGATVTLPARFCDTCGAKIESSF